MGAEPDAVVSRGSLANPSTLDPFVELAAELAARGSDVSDLRSERWFGGHELSGFIHRTSLPAEAIARGRARRPARGRDLQPLVRARHLQPPLPRPRRGGQARRAAGGRAAARVPDDLAGREPDEADGDALPQPDGDGRRGMHPRLSPRRGRPARRLRQDRARGADGSGERRRPGDHDHRRPLAGRRASAAASSAPGPTSGTTSTSCAAGG